MSTENDLIPTSQPIISDEGVPLSENTTESVNLSKKAGVPVGGLSNNANTQAVQSTQPAPVDDTSFYAAPLPPVPGSVDANGKYREPKVKKYSITADGRKIRNRQRVTAGDVVFHIINYTVFALFTLACLFPFYYLFINTISDNKMVLAGEVQLYPIGLQFDNYLKLLGVTEIPTAALVTVGRTVIGTALMVVASALIGYLVTKKEMWGRKFIYRMIVITMYFNAGMIPWYLTLSMLGLTNNFLGYIIPGIIAPFNIILVKTYIESIPAELEESASMDGAGYMKIFTLIILPLTKPILATIAIFGAVGHWNSFTDSIILMSSENKLRTLQHILYVYLNKTSNLGAAASTGQVSQDMVNATLDNKALQLTVAMATIIPILLVYPFMSKYFQKGIMLGAVKG
jgi:multiple sugar transport system permease protein/putative aldouronate transport system permease protein